MRPRLLTPRKIILFLVAATVFVGLSVWISRGMPLPGAGVPSTAGKLAFISDRAGNPDVWMMNPDGTDPVPVTRDSVREDQPSWSESGRELTFAGSKSASDNPQVYIADATTGRNAIAVTRTSGAKSNPVWDSEQEVRFLDAGKLTSYNTSAQESHAIFPEAEHKRAILAMFPQSGGVVESIPLDVHTNVMIVNVEDGQLLLLYAFDHDHPKNLVLAVIGSAEKIHLASVEGGFTAAFQNGGPLPAPDVLMNYEIAQVFSSSSGAEEGAIPVEMLQSKTKARLQPGNNIVVRFDLNSAPNAEFPLPFAVREFKILGDKIVAIPTNDKNQAEQQGVFVISPAEHKYDELSKLPASQMSLSPDGKHIAFAAKNDIYIVSSTGGEVKNITGNKGVNSYPVWSPARPETATEKR